MTMVRAWSVRSAPPPETTTVPGPATLALPRIATAPAFSSSWKWPASLGKSVPSRTDHVVASCRRPLPVVVAPARVDRGGMEQRLRRYAGPKRA